MVVVVLAVDLAVGVVVVLLAVTVAGSVGVPAA